jgi:hypothetical protein
MSTLRQKAGALAYDWIPFELRLRRHWSLVRNRRERLDVNRSGVQCLWLWTTDLHICSTFPSMGVRLMRAAFAEWPIAPGDGLAETASPRVSFIIGHRGAERIPHLLTAIRSIAGQRGASCECIVVEQSETVEARAQLPAGVRYVHDAVAAAEPYNRSRAFNAGARAARGDVLILHDNDMVVPRDYAAAATAAIDDGWDFANLIRFVFYLRGAQVTFDAPPERVVQNTQGGSIVARRDAFFDIGEFDPDFVGWGGEDNDFWDRAATRRVQRHGRLPMLHLWHPPQPEKQLGQQAPAAVRYWQIRDLPAEERIARLKRRER